MAVDRHTAASQPQRSELAPLVRGWGQRALLTQQQLAERAGLGLRTITRLESGNSGRLRPGSVLLLSKALGLSESERSQLLAAAGGHPAQPVPAPAAPVPAQLPAEVAGFTGRSTYVAELDAPLAGGRTDGRAATAVAISAIAGTAGIGKTALTSRDVCAIHTPLARHSTGRRSRTAMRPPTMTPQRVPLHAT